MPPLFKAMVQIIFFKTVQELRHFSFTSSTDTKWVPFEDGLDLWKKEDVAGSKVRRIRGVSKHSYVFTG
jgi:hypothetical protein